MSDETRETRLLGAITVLTDTLVSGYDAVEIAQVLVDTCADVFDIGAAGLLVAAPGEGLDVLASTSEASRLVEVLQLASQEGPCLDCFRTGQPVSIPNIRDVQDRWSAFAARASDVGFLSVHAVPLRSRDIVIGTLNLFGEAEGELNERDQKAARALADVTTLGILQHRNLRSSELVQQQLQDALSSRVLIEQAKGFIAHEREIGVDNAFSLLRTYARSNHLRLIEVADRVIAGRLKL